MRTSAAGCARRPSREWGRLASSPASRGGYSATRRDPGHEMSRSAPRLPLSPPPNAGAAVGGFEPRPSAPARSRRRTPFRSPSRPRARRAIPGGARQVRVARRRYDAATLASRRPSRLQGLRWPARHLRPNASASAPSSHPPATCTPYARPLTPPIPRRPTAPRKDRTPALIASTAGHTARRLSATHRSRAGIAMCPTAAGNSRRPVQTGVRLPRVHLESDRPVGVP
ncbi:Protein of unknown function [Gryllus bimaculatus]|nr:Protein of unknown function [Gryllus bimaculatus]